MLQTTKTECDRAMALGAFYGLDEKEVRASREKHGENVFKAAKKHTFVGSFFKNLNDPIIKILLFALALNLLFLIRGGDIYETVGIGISVFLATFISTLSEHSSEAAFKRLGEENRSGEIKVYRAGSLLTLPTSQLVVGDIILLGAGEKIPADCIMLSGEVSVDQSAMTGENKEIFKKPYSGMVKGNVLIDPSLDYALLCGCNILSGECAAQVTSVGNSTFLGGISLEILEDTRESPLKIRLSKLARTISRLGYIAAFLVAFAYLINSFVLDSGMHPTIILMKLGDWHYLFSKLLHAFTLGLTIVVVAVPEGLPLMISVVLSANIGKMAKDNVLVRKAVGIEAAGSMNILFTDKTGTLTEGKMSVSEYISGTGRVKAGGSLSPKDPISKYFALSALFNTSSKSSLNGGKKRAVGGNSTDLALLADVLGRGFDDFEKRIKVQEKLPFSSDIKMSAVRISGEESSIFIKGAPEKLMPFIKNCIDEAGRTVPFDPRSFDALIKERTKNGTRVILAAKSDRMPSADMSLTLVGAICLTDKLRAETPASVKKLRNAGIHVVMITGDGMETACAIGKECGILDETVNVAISGAELQRMNDMRLRELLPTLGVVARALPSDKSRLVRIAQEADMVVGMTGDGINDAPALRRADIGFAMGSGTQVAKDAGDIIILDNDLSSIAKAVLYGRGIFKNIRKFITLQLTMNLCAVGISMIGPFIGYDSPVTVVQMLWINIIMDTLGGIAFAGEHACREYLLEKPKRRDEPILNGYMIGEILTMGVFTVGICIAFLKLPHITALFRYDAENIYLLTAFFALFIFMAVFNCFTARTDSLYIFHDLGKNKVFIFIMLMIAVIQTAFIYFGGSVLRTVPLTAEELKTTITLSLLVFPADFLRKMFLRIFGAKALTY